MISPFLLEPQQQKGIQFCSFSKCIAKAYLLCHRSNPRFCSQQQGCFDGNVKLMKAIYSFKTKSSFWIWAATTKCSAADYFRLLQLYPHVFHSSSTVSFLSFDGCFYGSAALLLLKNALRTLVTGSTPFRTDTHFRNSLEMTFEVT